MRKLTIKKSALVLLLMILLVCAASAVAEEEPRLQALVTGYEQLQQQHGPCNHSWPAAGKVALVRLMRDAELPIDLQLAEELLDTKISAVQQGALAAAILESNAEDPPLRFLDVNGDGAQDIVLVTHRGVRSTRHAAWLWDAAANRFALVQFPGMEQDGLWDYSFPGEGLLLNHLSDGFTDEHWALYRWEGLVPVQLGTASIRALKGMVSETLSPAGQRVTQHAVEEDLYTNPDRAAEAESRRQRLVDALLALRHTAFSVLPDPLYYNPIGGSSWHVDPNCRTVKADYLPLTPFSPDLLEDDAHRHLTPCPICSGTY